MRQPISFALGLPAGALFSGAPVTDFPLASRFAYLAWFAEELQSTQRRQGAGDKHAAMTGFWGSLRLCVEFGPGGLAP